MEPADWRAADPWRRPCSSGLAEGSPLPLPPLAPVDPPDMRPMELAVAIAASWKGLTMGGGCCWLSCGAVPAV